MERKFNLSGKFRIRTIGLVLVSILCFTGILVCVTAARVSVLMRKYGITEQEYEHYAEIDRYMGLLEHIVLPLLVAVLILTVVVIARAVYITGRYLREIEEGRMLEERGCYELRYLARVINERSSQEKQCKQKKLQQYPVDFDNLTGAVNRNSFEQMVRNLLDRGLEQGGFLLVDVDRFRQINDTYGWEMGDQILQSVAETLHSGFRSCDLVGRIDGDRFAVWLSGLSEDSDSYIRKKIAVINDVLLHPSNHLPPVSLSAGGSFFVEGDDYKRLYKKADTALHTVKEDGRCGCEIYTG